MSKARVERILIILCAGATVILSGCGHKVDRSRLTDRLTVYNWEEYLAPETIPEFEKEFGVKVDLKTYEDEEVMLTVSLRRQKRRFSNRSLSWPGTSIPRRLKSG